MSDTQGTNKTPNDPVKEQIAQDKFGKGYDELTAHERVIVGGTKGGIVTKTPNDPVKEQIAQDKFGKSYDECTAHERQQVGGTKGGIVTKGGAGDYGGHYQGEGNKTEVEHTGPNRAG